MLDFLKGNKKPEIKKVTVDSKSSAKYKSNLDEIELTVYKTLKPFGFKKKGRTFNRQTETGLYQIINFQSGQFPFGNTYEIPGVKENKYGQFTVNMGLCFAEIYSLMFPAKPKTFYQEYDSQLRTRLSQLTKGEDFWWSLDSNNSKTSSEIIEGINSVGLDWFALIDSREKFCSNWKQYASSNSPRLQLDAALVMFFTDRKKGEKLIQEYFDSIANDRKPHIEYVRKLAKELGVTLK